MQTLEKRIQALEPHYTREARLEDMLRHIECKRMGIEEPAYLKNLNWEPFGQGILKLLGKK